MPYHYHVKTQPCGAPTAGGADQFAAGPHHRHCGPQVRGFSGCAAWVRLMLYCSAFYAAHAAMLCQRTALLTLYMLECRLSTIMDADQIVVLQVRHTCVRRLSPLSEPLQQQQGQLLTQAGVRHGNGHHMLTWLLLICSTARLRRWAGMRSCSNSRGCTQTCGSGSRRPPRWMAPVRLQHPELHHGWPPRRTCRALPRPAPRRQPPRGMRVATEASFRRRHSLNGRWTFLRP